MPHRPVHIAKFVNLSEQNMEQQHPSSIPLPTITLGSDVDAGIGHPAFENLRCANDNLTPSEEYSQDVLFGNNTKMHSICDVSGKNCLQNGEAVDKSLLRSRPQSLNVHHPRPTRSATLTPSSATSSQRGRKRHESMMSLSNIPFNQLWQTTSGLWKKAFDKSTYRFRSRAQQTKEWLFSRLFVTWFFFRPMLFIVLFVAAIVRFNGLSGIYLLCLLGLPLMPNPTRATMAGRTGVYMKIMIIIGCLACITQLIFQILLIVEEPYGSQLEFCNGTESLWRQLGYQRLDNLSIATVCRLVVPDVLVLVAGIVVFAVCRVLLKPTENQEEAEDSGEVYHRRQVRPSIVMDGIRSSLVMILCALVAVILPSAISAFYFLTFLLVVTWWSFYKSWGSKFNAWLVLWLLYSGAHLMLLYLYQFPFFQELVPPEYDMVDSSNDFFARLFGLTAIITHDCLDDPRILEIVKDHNWPVYVNPALILVFYIYVATQVRSWLDGAHHEKVPRRRKKVSGGEKEDEAQEQSNGEKKVPKQDGVKEGEDTCIATTDGSAAAGSQEKRLMNESAASYQAMDDTGQEQTKDRPELERSPSDVSEASQEGGKRVGPLATLVGYCTKQCYLAALILMMCWSIAYHSWLTFVLLLWACAIWIIPAGTTRKRALYTSPLLVFYAECLLLIQFVYGLNLTDKEMPVKVYNDKVNLREIGLMKYDIPFIPLGVQLMFTCIFWLTLRQFLRERKLAQITDGSPGIILQPLGMIFSGPNEEVPALTEHMNLQETGELPEQGKSETMSTIGNTIMQLLAKYWIFLCGAMFLIVSLEATVDIFKIIYMGLFLLIVNIFMLSFTIFRFISKPFAWLVVLYSVCTLALIYTYQFEDFPSYWTNGTRIELQTLHDLGLRQYSTSELFVNLLIPTTFIIVFMIQLHYYHDTFLAISEIKPSGYKPGSLREEKDDGDGEAVEGPGTSAEGKSEDEADKPKKKKTASKLKHYTKYLVRSACQSYIHVTRAIWRCLEIHIIKLVFFTIVIVATQEVSAVNGIFIFLIFLAIPFPSLFRLASLFTMLWASAVLFVKMVYQLELVPVEDWIMDCNNTDDFPIKSNFSKVEWFGFEQVSNFSDYVIGYVAIILMLLFQSIVVLHQRQYRHENNVEKIKDSIIFPNIKRENADEGLVAAFKFLANYCFYKFGLEICFLTTVIVASVRLDFLGAIYMGIMICMAFSRRRTVATAWPFYAMLLVVLFPIAYCLALGFPPLLCWVYPWTGKIPEEFITWLYFPDYLVRPHPIFILADFFQLIFVCLQWQVFRIEKTTGASYPGGDNYEVIVDVENISENPVPNFVFNKSYLDFAKTIIFSYGFWITLALVFLAGTSRVSLLGLIYIIFSFYFLWAGQDFMIRPTATVFKQWNLMLAYNLFVIMIKVALQLAACAYLSEILDANLCWLIQLLGVVCLQNGFDSKTPNTNSKGVEKCEMPTGEARLVWDVVVFIFLLIQRRIFTSNYFQYIVLELDEEKRLASKGAELINDLLAARVHNKRKEEQAILEGIRKKMQRIREKQSKVSNNKEYLEPQSHGEAVRGAGGYYMFQNESDSELSDLEPEINLENEIEEGPLAAKHRKEKEALEAKSSPWQLAFNAVMSTPEEALEKDVEKKKEAAEHADDDESYKDASDDALDASDGAAEQQEVDDEFRSMGDDDDLEEEDGVLEKTESRLTLTWLIFMRLIDAIVYQLDRISEEYRYVGRELRKLTSEGRKRRAQKKQLKAEEAATAVVQDESETGAADDIQVEGEDEEPRQGKRVMIKEDPTAEVDRDHRERTPADEIERSETESQSTETGSSEKFERSMPRPVRLVYAMMYALIAHSQLFCYFLIILTNMLAANIPSMVLPVLVFLWAMLSVPRPTKRFWIFVITYTEIIVIFKYTFQFTFYPWNSEQKKLDNLDNPLWWPRLFGMDQSSSYAIRDLFILLAVFFHRSILKKHGLWVSSQVVPDIEGEAEVQPAINDASTDKSVEDTDGKQKKKKKKKKKKEDKEKKEKKKKKDKKEKSGEEAAKALSSGGDTSQDEDPGQVVKAAVPPDDGGGDKEAASLSGSEEVAEEKKSFFAPLKEFYNHMVDPTYTAVTDVYVPMFLCDLLNFLIVAFASWAFGEQSAQTDVTQLIMSNQIPTTFLILLIVQFILMIIDRGIYLRKSITGKFIFLIIMVIGIHVWFFFILPVINNRKFIDNTPAQLFYFFKCIYFGLSAFQVRSGYPTRILGNCLCKSYNLLNLFAFYGWRAAPFLLELRILMDWLWTNTTLTLAHWVIIEDIYSNAYITKCWRKMEKEYPVPRGQQKGAVSKYAQGGGMLLGICLIIWFPLIIISLSNTNSIANPPSDATVTLQLGGYEPLFTMSAQEQSLQQYSKGRFDELSNSFGTSKNAKLFLDSYRPEDVYSISIDGQSSSTWGISPPSRTALMDDLLGDYDISMKFRYSITRDSESSLVISTVSNEVSLTLDPVKNRTIRMGIADQLNFTNPDPGPVQLNYVFPPYIVVPAEGLVTPADLLMPNGIYSYTNISVLLQRGGIDQLESVSEWWSVKEISGEQSKSELTIITFNDRVASELFAPLSSYGIIGLYISLVLVVGKFVRMMFSGVSFTIMFTELPNVDRILRLCLDIYLVRECGEMELEEDLMAKLIFLYRSPETLIQYTKFKRD